MAFVASPDVQSELALTATGLAAALFSAPLLLALVVEPLALAWTTRRDRRVGLVAALLVMAGTQALVAGAESAVTLALALGVWGTASGVATTLAEVALVARASAGRAGSGEGAPLHRAMARWALLGSVGDLAAPLLYAACAWLGLGWRAALLAGAGLAVLDAALVALGPPLREEDEDDEDDERPSWREVVRNGRVWAWLLAASACTLFDEILVAYGSLWLRERGADAAQQGLAFGLFAVGTAVGQAASGWALSRWGPRRLLVGASLACGVVWPVWLALPWPVAVPAAAVVGVAVAPMWALATAEAYSVAPRPGVVAALGVALEPLALVAPLVIGGLAHAFGLLPALLVLLVQPVVVGIVALLALPGRAAPPDAADEA